MSRLLPILIRFLTIIYIMACFEVGVVLFVLPWLSIWDRNYFVSQYPIVAAVALNHYFRGAISGVGLADIWLALYEFWRLRKKLGLIETRPPR